MPKANKKNVAIVLGSLAGAAAAIGIASKVKSNKSFVLEEATLEEIQKALTARKISSKELTQMYIDRIEQYDQAGPTLKSIIEINPDALQIAEELDRNRPENAGLLYGIPVLVKDNVDTADNMHTSAGAVTLANNIASEDAFLAKKLREAGAIIIGKANMSEFANFITENLPNGFSSRGGQVLNPYGPGTFDVGGSSSGTGAGIAANLAVVGIGTETSGSILSPASSNSLVGIKPTLGLVSRSGIIPLAHSQDTAGPMARTVSDAAILLTAIAGYDEKDEATNTKVDKSVIDYTEYLVKNGLKGARIGVDRTTINRLTAEEQKLMEKAIQEMKRKGAVMVDPIEIPTHEHESRVLYHEFKHDLNAYLEGVSDDVPVKNLADIIAYNKEHAETAIPYGQTILEHAQTMSDDPEDPDYLEDRRLDLVHSSERGIDVVMEEHQLDAILFPNNLGAAMPAKAGYPSITVPGGYTKDGKPFGVTFTALAYREPTLIKLAYGYEQATKHRKAPKLDK
ncbi:amidase family protein [Gracilibacillus sp. S3-1-1]|uniref:Amidase family protein n=1 Tax=Gracilibacillus pellucidus TaxID=3095368 RepID=A0ACC6M0K5_9BACI|nr:amidase family protein [Gracilibacillus sp. S3-1-1]MDX8044417.1 amidase family protein [Gracilibacillus sp. S3-1-1]